jgi:hypothetical protein
MVFKSGVNETAMKSRALIRIQRVGQAGSTFSPVAASR